MVQYLHDYFPYVEQFKRPSTLKGYRDIWTNHVKALAGSVLMRDVETFTVKQWVDSIAGKGLTRNSLKHIKSVLSAIFKHARNQGFYKEPNPVKDVEILPTAPAPAETYAYSLDEIQRMMEVLPEPVCTVVALAAFTGLRHGEIAGLRWEDYQDGELHVNRSVWHGRLGEPKTEKSRAGVPVIPALAHRLDMHRLRTGGQGFIFSNGSGTPYWGLGILCHRVIRPALRKAGLQWHGWHACRRGLASNLHSLGVPDLVIQRILRHSNVSVTQQCYIKTRDEQAHAAMAKLAGVVGAPAQAPVVQAIQ